MRYFTINKINKYKGTMLNVNTIKKKKNQSCIFFINNNSFNKQYEMISPLSLIFFRNNAFCELGLISENIKKRFNASV